MTVLSDVLPYVGIFPEYDESELADLQVSVPSVQCYTVEEAKKNNLKILDLRSRSRARATLLLSRRLLPQR